MCGIITFAEGGPITHSSTASASRFERWKQPIQHTLAIGLHLLLIIAAVQAWMTGWPGRIALTAATLVAIGASAALFRRWRSAPFIVGCSALAAFFLWASLRYGSDAPGLRIAGLRFGVATAVLVAGAVALTGWMLWRLASSLKVPKRARFIPAVLALYSIALISLGIARGEPASWVLAGDGLLPWWISGWYFGSAALVPLGLVISLGVLGWAVAKRRTSIVPAVALLLVMLTAFALSGLELTRNGRPNLAQFLLPAGAGSASSADAVQVAAASTGAGGTLGATDESLAPFDGKDVDDIFARVAVGVRYEPYSGILRGAVGTAVARSGNAADQSVLLAHALRRAGYKVRFARGSLPDANIDAVVRGMYPPRVAVERLGPEYAPYDPAADSELRALVRDHMWVEVYQGESLLPLDPSFPRAKIGEAYAENSEHFDTPPDALHHRMEATLREETVGGQSRELGRFAGSVAELGMRPISLVVRGIPQSSAGEKAEPSTGGPAGAIGGMGGALGGATEAPPHPRGRPNGASWGWRTFVRCRSREWRSLSNARPCVTASRETASAENGSSST
jgi:hypothetical protein